MQKIMRLWCAIFVAIFFYNSLYASQKKSGHKMERKKYSGIPALFSEDLSFCEDLYRFLWGKGKRAITHAEQVKDNNPERSGSIPQQAVFCCDTTTAYFYTTPFRRAFSFAGPAKEFPESVHDYILAYEKTRNAAAKPLKSQCKNLAKKVQYVSSESPFNFSLQEEKYLNIVNGNVLSTATDKVRLVIKDAKKAGTYLAVLTFNMSEMAWPALMYVSALHCTPKSNAEYFVSTDMRKALIRQNSDYLVSVDTKKEEGKEKTASTSANLSMVKNRKTFKTVSRSISAQTHSLQ